jgi:hypothetical protein
MLRYRLVGTEVPRYVSQWSLAVDLAVAVFVDATVIRAVLLPSVMALLGDRTWYLPRRLTRFTVGKAGPRSPTGPVVPGPRPPAGPHPEIETGGRPRIHSSS